MMYILVYRAKNIGGGGYCHHAKHDDLRTHQRASYVICHHAKHDDLRTHQRASYMTSRRDGKLPVSRHNKGFTLVELIVVIVILAILAAILVPALLGYIDKAKDQQILLEAKSVLTAAQAELSTAYASEIAPNDLDRQRILDTADVSPQTVTIRVGKQLDITKASLNHEAYTVYGLCYVDANGKECYYTYDESTGRGTWDAGTEGSKKYGFTMGQAGYQNIRICIKGEVTK